MSNEWEAETVFDLLGSELVRELLALTSVEALSAEALAERCEASQPTVYRRLNALQEYDLVAENTEYDEEGNHYKTYEARLDEVRFGLEDGRFTVDLQLKRRPADIEDLPTDSERET